MLALCLMDPESLTAIFPIVSTIQHRLLLEHLHELRRIWWMLSLSLVSTICHLILVWHVRSTAPHYALLNNGNQKRPSVYFALRSASIGAVNESYTGRLGDDSDEPALVHAMNEFMVDLQGRLQRTKMDWSKRLDDFTSRLTINERPVRSHRGNPLAPLTPFRVLLQLFAYEDVLENGKLDFVFDIDDGESLIFYVPQLLSFLLHGALWCSPQLEDWILDKCYKNVHFAHRCYWFLRAWCLEVPVEVRKPILSRNNSSDGLAPFLDEPVSPTSPYNSANCGTRPHPVATGRSRCDKFLPEERAMIERLMLRVKECGGSPARVLEHGNGEHDDAMNIGSHGILSETVGSNGPDFENSPSAVMSAVEAGLIPVHPNTGYPSLRHLDSVSSRQTFGFSPLDRDESGLSTKDDFRHGHSKTENFDKTPRFVDALIFLADSLFDVPREKRKEELRNQLRALECELLPSNSVYLPIGTTNHRVWRIVADESIAISTKERVPCIVYLEVVEYPVKRRKGRSWSLLPRKVQSASTVSSEGELEPTPLVTEMSSHSTSSLEYALPETVSEQSEAAIVNQWRMARRDPTRRISLFDKMTTTVRDKVQVPLDNMKIKVRDSLNHFRDRTGSDELRALTLAETLVEGSTLGVAGATELRESRSLDVESGDLSREAYAPGDGRSLSRISSVGSLASMGQWSSPEPAGKANKPTKGRLPKTNATLAGARRRLDKDEPDRGNRSLLYGSDNEEECEEETSSASPRTQTAGDSSLSQYASDVKKAKPPPVVFRESWQKKEDRIRKKSAYSSHRSWRLKPIMIKANDDL